ncbi:MAG: zinc metallopeptidase [Proteobacteria bacterium]|nr:zinc metallopeptidase [Pseudomonadota bacterium]
MRWGDFRQSDNVEDRTGQGSFGGGYGGGGGFGGGGMRLGLGGIVILFIVSLIFGINPLQLLGGGDGGPAPQSAPPQAQPGYGPQSGAQAPAQKAPIPDEQRMIRGVLGDTEDVWTAVFRTMGKQYPPPTLVLFTGAVQSACGRASAAMGPFYCAADQKLYLDTSFFRELAQRFGAPGEFAQAYVVAHEVGHHVQNLLGTMQKVDRAQARASERDRNALSVRLELQADCYAGVWGYYAAKRNLLDPGDVDDGLRAAAAVGDDKIQKMTQGYVVPEGFTHGSAQQRSMWFKRGLDTGDIRNCDTFAAQ